MAKLFSEEQVNRARKNILEKFILLTKNLKHTKS